MSSQLTVLTDQPYTDLNLEIENDAQIDDPSEKTIEAQLSRLDHNNPSFMILGRTGGSYAQVLGGESGYVAEIRVVHPKTYEHFSVYQFGAADRPDVQVGGSSGGVRVPEGERLTKDQALRALVAFARNHALPSDLALKNVTANFLKTEKPAPVAEPPRPVDIPSAPPVTAQQPASPWDQPKPAAPSQSTPAQSSPPGLIARIRSLFGL